MSLQETTRNPEQRKLRQPAPAGRSYESLRRHFDCERAIAERLRNANRETRKQIYATMYDELFAEVPDHSRLTRRADESLTAHSIDRKTRLLRPFMRRDATLLEFGSGDCRFALAMTGHFGRVEAVDIADQVAPGTATPENFRLTVYDGYTLDLPQESIDIAFSDQLIEHLHPEDTADHLRLVHRLLRPGGCYLIRTPHRLTGPHDVSRFFSQEAQCFHLKEWTYGELAGELKRLGYTSIRTYWFGKGILLRLPRAAFAVLEALGRAVPPRLRHRLLPLLLPGIVIAAGKRP